MKDRIEIQNKNKLSETDTSSRRRLGRVKYLCKTTCRCARASPAAGWLIVSNIVTIYADKDN
jgi:hypothetical protein